MLYHGGHFYHFEKITVQRKKAWGNFYYFLEISKGKKPHVPRWLSLKIVIVTFAEQKKKPPILQSRQVKRPPPPPPPDSINELIIYKLNEPVSHFGNWCRIQIGIPACILSSEYFTRMSLYLVRLKIFDWIKLLRRH